MKAISMFSIALLAGLGGLFSCNNSSNAPPDEDVAQLLAAQNKNATPAEPSASVPERPAFNPRLLRRFKPISGPVAADDNPSTPEKIALGRTLYYDARLSRNHDVSCNSCHALDRYGVDGEKTSKGHGGQRGNRNSPTVFHAAGFFSQFWDGRAENVEEQAKGPITNPIEMALASPEDAVAVVKSIPAYVSMFKAAFPNDPKPVSFDNLAKAIGCFERGLITPSRWDKFLEGDKSALTAQEVEGLKIFTNVGCMVCHTGEYLGGSMFEKAGVVEAWPNQADKGRHQVTKHKADEMMFKVPTLRNVEKTAPYFHDGSVATLPEAVRIMGRHQLGLELTDAEVDAIVAWLATLTGELPMDYIARPTLPSSTPKTPKPNPT